MWDSAKDKTRIDQDLTPITNLTYHSLFLLNYVFTYLGIRKEIYLFVKNTLRSIFKTPLENKKMSFVLGTFFLA